LFSSLTYLKRSPSFTQVSSSYLPSLHLVETKVKKEKIKNKRIFAKQIKNAKKQFYAKNILSLIDDYFNN